jgi:lipoprotein-anchoring transpeptidase ErfK/SrfK
MASFPCSIAKSFSRVPAGELRIVEFAPDPNYTFDPRNFPESGLEKKLLIPPGPNNPVGVYWMSLSHPGFGIHGTRSPETIGRQESRGCFRLTNWDVRTVARAVTATIPVRILVPGASPAEAVAPVPAEPQVP